MFDKNNTIKLVRFSNSGFEPQFQKYQFEQMKYITTGKYEADIINLPTEYAKRILLNGVASYIKNYNKNFEYDGIHAFFFSQLNGAIIDFYLNHQNKLPDCYIAFCPPTTLGYSLNTTIYNQPCHLEKLLDNNQEGVYIPKSQLNNLFDITLFDFNQYQQSIQKINHVHA